MSRRKFGWSALVLLALAIEPTSSSADDSWEALKQARLTATGRVLLPDGSPAASAIVSAIDGERFNEIGRTDAQGRFELRHVFGNYCGIHAHTRDWRQQAWLVMSGGHAQSALKEPVELKLMPAREQQVVVNSQGRPVGGVKLVATGAPFRVEGTTGIDGRALLWIPQGLDWHDIDAWDAKLGGAEIRCYSPSRPSGVIELALRPPQPHTIHMVDQGRNPMRNLRFSLTCVGADEFDESSVQTDAQGQVTIPWVPAGVPFIEPRAYSRLEGGRRRRALEKNTQRDHRPRSAAPSHPGPIGHAAGRERRRDPRPRRRIRHRSNGRHFLYSCSARWDVCVSGGVQPRLCRRDF